MIIGDPPVSFGPQVESLAPHDLQPILRVVHADAQILFDDLRAVPGTGDQVRLIDLLEALGKAQAARHFQVLYEISHLVFRLKVFLRFKDKIHEVDGSLEVEDGFLPLFFHYFNSYFRAILLFFG